MVEWYTQCSQKAPPKSMRVRIPFPVLKILLCYNSSMANYSFTVDEGTDTTFTVHVYGLVSGMTCKSYLYANDWVLKSEISVQTAKNQITVTIPSSLATTATMPAKYKVEVSKDNWSTSILALTGQIFFEPASTDDEPVTDVDRGEPGGVAALDLDGDVINAAGTKIMPVLIIHSGDPIPAGTKDNTLIAEIT